MESKQRDFVQNKVYKYTYEVVVYLLVVLLIPLILLVFLNTHLIRELIAARNRRLNRSIGGEDDDEEQNLTLVMVVIVLVFIFCQTPAFLNQLLFVIIGPTEYYCATAYFIFFQCSNLIVCANSAANFVIYYAFRKQFRARLAAFCGRRRLSNSAYLQVALGERNGTRTTDNGVERLHNHT